MKIITALFLILSLTAHPQGIAKANISATIVTPLEVTKTSVKSNFHYSIIKTDTTLTFNFE